MDPTGAAASRHRKPPYSDRLLGLSVSQRTTSSPAAIAYELNEDDVFWTGDFAHPPNPRHRSPPATPSHRSPLSKGFPRLESFGILAALPEDHPPPRATPHHHHHHHSSSRMIPTIPRPPLERQSSIPSKFHQSAPVSVPVMSKAAMRRRHREFDDIDDDDDDEGDGEMLPPHEIVARSSARAPMLACSVLEGVGRTLKGRDLRQVRNAVWRKTGFLD